MFPTIDAAAGMAFLYLLLSLVCSALREAAEAWAKKRSDALRAGVNRLLGAETAALLYLHPLIAGLAVHARGPSHIPGKTFATALLDITGGDIANGDGVPDRAREVLRSVTARAGTDAALIHASIEDWFNAAMDSVTQDYKRHTQLWLAAIGLVVTIAMNADSIRMASTLLTNAALRSALIQAGGQFTPLDSGAQAAAELRSLGMPIGWSGSTSDNTLPWKQPWTGPWWNNSRLLLQWHWAGWLITVAAISLGAPFWFDLLKRLIPARSPEDLTRA